MSNQEWWELQGIRGMLPEVEMFCGITGIRAIASVYARLRHLTSLTPPTYCHCLVPAQMFNSYCQQVIPVRYHDIILETDLL